MMAVLDPAAAVARAEAMVRAIPELANTDADIRRRAVWVDCAWMIGIGDREWHVTQREGEIVALEPGPLFMRAWSFSLTAAAPDWLKFWEPIPEPGWHDILAMSKRGTLVLRGDLTPLMRNLQVVKDILATPRSIVEARG